MSHFNDKNFHVVFYMQDYCSKYSSRLKFFQNIEKFYPQTNESNKLEINWYKGFYNASYKHFNYKVL